MMLTLLLLSMLAPQDSKVERKLDLENTKLLVFDSARDMTLKILNDGKVEGAHVLPVIWNRRLYVFWPILEEKPDDQGPGRYPMTESQAHKDWRKANRERQEGGWLSRRSRRDLRGLRL